MAPPYAAVLSVKLELSTLSVLPVEYTAPPLDVALLPSKLAPVTVTVAPFSARIAPPVTALLPVNTISPPFSTRLSFELFTKNTPPMPSVSSALATALLLCAVKELTVSVDDE